MGSFQVADSLATAVYNKIKSTICNLIYPVGSIKMTVTNTNPSTYLGGTWSLWGAGRVPVGIDTSQTEFDTSEKTGGTKTHTLTKEQIPSHNHEIPELKDDSGSNHTYPRNTSRAARTTTGTFKAWWGNTGSTGGGQPHNNLQPYITCYMWKRTA